MTDTEPVTDPNMDIHMAVFAQVRLPQSIVLRNEVELVEQDDGSVVEQAQRVYAKVGEIVDVSHWHSINAYVERGSIMLLGPTESEAHRQRLLAARKGSDGAKGQQSAQRRQTARK